MGGRSSGVLVLRGRAWRKICNIADGGVGGAPALLQSNYGTKGNFEVLVPLATGGIAHYWRNNDAEGIP